MSTNTTTSTDDVEAWRGESDHAKWTWAHTIVDLWEASLQLAALAKAGRITEAELHTLQSRLLSVAQGVYSYAMDPMSEGGTIDVEEVYSDGSPIWSRVTPTTGPAADPDLIGFTSGDLAFWIGGLQGELPFGVSVVPNLPPHARVGV